MIIIVYYPEDWCDLFLPQTPAPSLLPSSCEVPKSDFIFLLSDNEQQLDCLWTCLYIYAYRNLHRSLLLL